MDFPTIAKSAASEALPVTARPTLHVNPTIVPSRFRMQLMRWSVRSKPARLSSPKLPTCCQAVPRSLRVWVGWKVRRRDVSSRAAGVVLLQDIGVST